MFICIAVVWAYAQILTSGGAYKHSPMITQINCRTDRANLISSAPWLAPSSNFHVSVIYDLDRLCTWKGLKSEKFRCVRIGRLISHPKFCYRAQVSSSVE